MVSTCLRLTVCSSASSFTTCTPSCAGNEPDTSCHEDDTASMEGLRISTSIDDFLLSLPLGTDQASAEVEAMVSQKLVEAEVTKAQLRQRLQNW